MQKRAKVRAALLDLEGVLDVLIDEKIVFQLAKDARLDGEELAKRMKDLELDEAKPEPVEGFVY